MNMVNFTTDRTQQQHLAWFDENLCWMQGA
jgi:hypothetical protein